MSIKITDKSQCTGCGACENVCPVKCISMEADSCGFMYPKVEKNKCVECGLCEKICPVVSSPQKNNLDSEQEAYAGWAKNSSIRYKSTSGGLFATIATKFIQMDGLVVGAVYGDGCRIEHIMSDSIEGVYRMRQSKYAQSYTGVIYSEIEKKLKDNKKVLFSGTPCHAAALRKYLRKDYDNLYIVDFICRGVNSPKAYNAWLRELEKKYDSDISNVWFKYKKYGWRSSPKSTRIEFTNGKVIVQNGFTNLYMSGYLGPNLYIRPSCGDCKFKGINRDSDITLADFWGIAKELDDNKGTSLILVNTKKGRELLELIKADVFFQKRTIEEILSENACFKESVSINEKSEVFLTSLDSVDFSDAIVPYVNIPWKLKIKDTLKWKIKEILSICRK